MPRAKINYTHEYPYHVYARSNNKENFYLDQSEVWEIFVAHLWELKTKFKCEIHAFVLMSNHYHMLLNTSEEFNLGQVMHWFQMSISRKINSEAGRINHVFGGPYQCSMITNNNGFENVFKYIYRNPVRAGVCNDVRLYSYSLINRDIFGIQKQSSLVKDLIFSDMNWMEWLNTPSKAECDEIIRKGLLKKTYSERTQSRLIIKDLLDY